MKNLLQPSIFLLFLFTTSVSFAVNTGFQSYNKDRCELNGFLGVTHSEPNQEKTKSLGYDVQGGTIVQNVIGCTAALKAGIQPMDYLYGVNAKTTTSSISFFCLLSEFETGETVNVQLVRRGQPKTVSVTLGERSDACHDQHPFPKRGFFGISDAESDNKPGALIDVSSNGPVASLGLQDGDRLLRINGYAIGDWHDLSTVKRLISDVENVSFDVIRDGQDLTFSGAIAENEHRASSNWTNRDWDKLVLPLQECKDEIEQAIADIDFDEIEREIESAIRSSDLKEETEDAVEEAMEAVREALSGLRSRNGSNNDASQSPDIDPMDMDATVEKLDKADVAEMEELISDMPKNRNLAVSDFSASPNPNEGRFRLSFQLPNEGDTRIAIYSASGREVYGYDLGLYSGVFTDELDIMRNGPGTYFLVIRQDQKAFVRKLILIKR